MQPPSRSGRYRVDKPELIAPRVTEGAVRSITEHGGRANKVTANQG